MWILGRGHIYDKKRLYLEIEPSSYHYYGVGKIGNLNLFDYSRKLAYVGMSRPKKLLCVAMQAKTYFLTPKSRNL